MAMILSLGTCNPQYQVNQETTSAFIEKLFSKHHQDINRLLQVVQNGEILKRHISAPADWFEHKHSFQEKNELYIKTAVELGVEAIDRCLEHEQLKTLLGRKVSCDEIDAIFFVSSSGIATPTIDARIMNLRSFSPHTKRVPIWGLGCAGGVAGISRAFDYCKAYPEANVLVLCIELCSLTFQREDYSKSNLIGTSLFADGVACALVSGDQSNLLNWRKGLIASSEASARKAIPRVFDTMSTFMPNSEDVMGWDLKDDGLYVVFSKDIPSIIRRWLKPNLEEFLTRNNIAAKDIKHFVAHPGGKKVLQAYRDALQLDFEMTEKSRLVLQQYGNMSSPTVLFVLSEFMESTYNANQCREGDIGIMLALGPGFSSELALIKWT
ncbi:chalcone synthase [Desulfuribacillus alkaliarsenatis]|uniref:Chalcone synthase n=2 Tax=Desulfuribacillus alkaliarsenatis TaxID=766136 RepID=A0A1E5G183_9FIRM|nr:chalcone synthase [Desulfuribacillus alkaliarsenatis]